MRDYRYRSRSLGDVLNYAVMIKEGVMLLKDGAFCAGWRYEGLDFYSTSDRELQLARLLINQAFCQLGDGWMLHADLIRKPVMQYSNVDHSHFPDPTSLLLDEERRARFLKDNTYFVSEMTFVMTYKPPADRESTFTRFFVQESTSALPQKGWEALLHSFETKIEQLENSLRDSLGLHRLNSTSLLSHLHECLTGLTHQLVHPPCCVYLDQFLSTQDFLGGLTPKIGNNQLGVLALNGFPLASFPGLLKKVSELPIAFRWSNRYLFLDNHTGEQQLKKHRRYWFQKHKGLMGLVREMFHMEGTHFFDEDALEMTEDINSALVSMQSQLVQYGFYTSVFILMEDDQENQVNQVNQESQENCSFLLKEKGKLLSRVLENQGFATRIETINAVEAYLGSLPGHGYQNIRKPMLSTMNLVDLIPLIGIKKSEDHHPCPYYPPESPPLFYAKTKGHTPLRISLHHGDVGHTLVIGDTGSGKSTLLGFLIAQHLRYPNAEVFLFDKGYSCFTLCHALSGTHYDIASDEQTLSFAPLKDIAIPTELNWACEWLEALFASQGLMLSPLQRQEIRRSLQHLKEQPSKTLTDLQITLQDPSLKQAIEFYTLSGAMGTLLDATTDDLTSQQVQVFEMQHVLNKEDKFTLPLLTYLFHQIDRRLSTMRPTLILIEEGHRFLKGRFGEQLDSWLRECRKHNAAVIFVTQGLSEIVQSPYKTILLNSCPTKFILPNSNATNSYNKLLYKELGLNDAHINRIATAIPKQDYCVITNNDHRFINLDLSSTFLALMSSTQGQERSLILNLRKKYEDEWVYYFFQKKDLMKVAENWMDIYQRQKKKKNAAEQIYCD